MNWYKRQITKNADVNLNKRHLHRLPMNKFIKVFIGLGSNLDRPAEQIKEALNALSQLPCSQSLQSAPWYSSKAIGPGVQSDYINTVASLETTLTPEALLDQLQLIEHHHGRQREVRWGARTLDLDILIYGNEIISNNRLEIPHPEMPQRGFVLQPLFDLAPDLTFPDSIKLSKLLSRCATSDLCLLKNTEAYKPNT
jgi:2-amino-4-hydroxy-6-hydroxymethyldihydropteridine diphosphokinase